MNPWLAVIIYLFVQIGIPVIIATWQMHNWTWKDDDYRGGD